MALFNKKVLHRSKKRGFCPAAQPCGHYHGRQRSLGQKAGLARSAGHKAGAEVFRTISKACGRIGIPYVTFMLSLLKIGSGRRRKWTP